MEEGLSLAQIATENFTSKSVIRSHLDKFGIPIRSPHNTGLRNASACFGLKRRRGKLVDNITERRIVNAVVDLKAQGLSLRQIAKFLTKVGVPTKQRGKQWHPEMVKRILNFQVHFQSTEEITNILRKEKFNGE